MSQARGSFLYPLSIDTRDFLRPALTTGNILRHDATPGMPERIIHNAHIHANNIGGPLIDAERGTVIGLNVVLQNNTPTNTALSAETVIAFLQNPFGSYGAPTSHRKPIIIAAISGTLALTIIVLALNKRRHHPRHQQAKEGT